MTDTDLRDQLRAVFLAALMIGSVMGAGVAFTGSAVAATNDGPEEFLDQGTDAGLLAAGETAVVQTIEVNDTDTDGGSGDTNPVNLTAVNVTEDTTNNSVSASNISDLSILDASGDSLGSVNPSDFTSTETIDITNVTIPDNGSTTIQVQVTVDENATENADLALQTQANWTEGGNSGTTAYVADGSPETLDTDAPDLTAPTNTADSNNDGMVDTISVTFDETVNNETVEASDFTLSTGNVDSVDTSGGDASTYDLTVSGVGDTAATPDVNITANSVEDVAGNTGPDSETQVTASDTAQPVVIDRTVSPTLVNDSDAPATVEVNLTFSENVSGSYSDGDVVINSDSTLTVAGAVNKDTFNGTVDIEDNETDVEANLSVTGLSDQDGNNLVEYDQEALTIDTEEALSLDDAKTADLNDDGMVDTINVTFSDDVSDDSVLSAIENNDFSIKEGTIQGINGGVANDDTVSLEVTDVGDTAATDEITVFSGVLEDTAGNPGPSNPTGITASDGASPIVTGVTLNETTVNKSQAPTDVEINATFSESIDTTGPDVSVLGLSQGVPTATGSADGDNELSVVVNIEDSTEDVEANVEITGGDDGSGNAVETFNETRLTVDTLVPTVTVNGTEAPEGEVVGGELDLTTFFDIADDDGGETTYLINTTDTGSDYSEVSNPSAFDTNTIDDTAFLTVRAVDTDDVGNEDQATTNDINVDNTAPDVTIDKPSETVASQSGGTLSVQATVDEQNVAGNATVVLEGDGNYIQYNASVSDLEAGTDLRLNTSENASANGALLPNQSATTGTFDTQTVYDLSVTVDDTTGKNGSATQADAIFLDDTSPANFSLVAPDDPTEYDLSDATEDKLVVSYGYTEDNTESVTVSLTNESGAVANVTVDESQYTNDGVIKSFELDLLGSFDTTSLADGPYNVSVTVTDLAGNELVDSTENATVYINSDSATDGTPSFQGPTPSATASIGDNPENVTVEATYNVSVPEVTDAGSIDEPVNELTNVDITSPDVTVDVRYYDASAGKYKDYSEDVAVEFSSENTTANATITESTTVDISDVGPTLEDGDRVLTRDASISSDVEVTAIASEGSKSDTDSVGANKNFVNNDTVAPELDSIEVDGNVDNTSDELVLTFSRPVNATAAGITSDDFGYINENGNENLYVTEVTGVSDDDTQITVTLNGSVEAGDVGSDIVSIQPDVLQNTEPSYKNASAASATIQEGTAPTFDSATVTDNASVIDVEFDEPVQAEDGSDLTAANLSYSGDANVTDVTQSDSESATVTLDADVTSSELDSGVSISADGVYDRFGNELTVSVDVTDESGASPLVIDTPSSQLIKQSDSTLDVAYRYVENVPDGTADVDITLNGPDTTTFNIDDSQFVANATKSLTLDLSDKGMLADGTYDLEIAVTDAADNTVSVTENAAVVINDDAPDVSDVDVAPDSDVAAGATVNVSYDYTDATNASSVTVHVVAAEDDGNFTSGDFDNATFEMVSKDVDMAPGAQEVEVDLSGVSIVSDNSDYEVYVTATDESGFTNLNTSAATIIEGTVSSDSLDVNAEQPTLDSVEANTGSDTVTVTFSEAIVAADGDLSADDFAYQDVTNSGAGTITDVARAGPDAVELTLDSAVTSSDLGSDLVNVRAGAINDTDGDNARQVSLSATALSDSTDPATPMVEASAINANNEDSYTVTVGTTSETTDVSVVLNGSNGTELSDSASSVTGEQSFTFNVSEFEDGPVDIDVELTDAGGNTASASTTVEKDTVAPTIESATTNAGTDTVSVAFSESVEGLSADSFVITSPAHEVVSVSGAGDSATLTLNASVPAAAINDSSVAVVAAPGVTDDAGNAITGDQKLTDVDAPMVTGVAADRGDENVTITFTENVNAGDDAAIDADDFTYTDNDGAGVSGIESATQTGPQTVVVTLNDSLTPSDLAEDHIGVAADSVFDSVGHPVEAADYTIGIESDLSVSSDGGTLTVTVVSPNDISDAIGSEVTVSEQYRELESLEGFELDERFETTLSASDFDEVEAGVYEASVDVPFDAEYTEDGVYSVSGTVDAQVMSAQTTVDTTAPYPTDAVLLDVTSEAQLDDTRDTTHIRVLFNEPIEASNILPSDVSIEGFDGDVVAVQDGGLLGSIEVVVEGKVQTGTHPTVTIDGDSYADLAGTPGADTGSKDSTVVHTDVLDLEKGQNYVSVPAASGDLPLDEIDTSAVDAIYAYDAESGSWQAYDPAAQENELTALEGGEGYIFVMDKAATIEVNVFNIAGAESGADPSDPVPTQQSLSEGWNLIGQYQEFDQQVDTALSSLSDGSVYDVLAQDENADGVAFESYAAGDFQTLERSEGYWVFVQDDEVYTEASGHTAGTSTTQTAL